MRLEPNREPDSYEVCEVLAREGREASNWTSNAMVEVGLEIFKQLLERQKIMSFTLIKVLVSKVMYHAAKESGGAQLLVRSVFSVKQLLYMFPVRGFPPPNVMTPDDNE